MATTTCGWCNRDVHMTQIARPSVVRGWLDSYVTDAAYRCDNSECGRFSVVSWYTDYDPTDSYRTGEPQSYDRQVVWSPPPVVRPAYDDVPDHIAAAAREAWHCHGHGAFLGTCAIARSVIEATAKDHGVTVQGIAAKIEALTEKNLIWGSLIESAHVVRQFGNDAAHGDLSTPPTADEARDVLDIMDELLAQLFTSPARSQRLRDSRAQRQSPA